jgi:uncharacterized protein
MKIDAFTHFLPHEYAERLMRLEDTAAARSIRKRVAGIPAIMDLELRLRQLDEFGDDYRQIISLPAPPIEDIGDAALGREMARLANDGQAELVQSRPERFTSFVAALPLADIDDAIEEAQRAVRELGAAGVQIYTNVSGAAWDDPRYLPFFDAIAELDATIWVHPSRNQTWADYPGEDRSRYEIWWTLGWPHETSVFMARMVFSGLFDRLPDLKFLTHHGGGTIPQLAGRVAGGWDQLGARTPEPERELVAHGLERRPLDYFKLFYADTALFGAPHAIASSLAFFGPERMLFASDSPFDPEKGPGYIRTTIADIESLDLADETREQIYAGNAQRLLRLRVAA